jgi:hypothetical protein
LAFGGSAKMRPVALLDFTALPDLERWLQNSSKKAES